MSRFVSLRVSIRRKRNLSAQMEIKIFFDRFRFAVRRRNKSIRHRRVHWRSHSTDRSRKRSNQGSDSTRRSTNLFVADFLSKFDFHRFSRRFSLLSSIFHWLNSIFTSFVSNLRTFISDQLGRTNEIEQRRTSVNSSVFENEVRNLSDSLTSVHFSILEFRRRIRDSRWLDVRKVQSCKTKLCC